MIETHAGTHAHDDHDLEDHDRGLVFDLATLDRRQLLKVLGFGGLNAGLFTIIGFADGMTVALTVPVGA
jgi:hypothetical protein